MIEFPFWIIKLLHQSESQTKLLTLSLSSVMFATFQTLPKQAVELSVLVLSDGQVSHDEEESPSVGLYSPAEQAW
jgi:hypothetical protein